MDAVRLHPPARDIRVESLPIPTLQHPDDAIVRITLAGLCGSDLHAFRGLEPFSKPFVMGHEFIGTVIALGSSYESPAKATRPALYSKLKIGDRVISPFTTSCAECHFCRLGHTSRCVESMLFGSPNLPGAQAQFIRVPKAGGTLFLLPSSSGGPSDTIISDTSSLLLADVLPTGYFAALQAIQHPNVQAIIAPRDLNMGLSVSQDLVSSELSMEDRTITCSVIGLGPVGVCGTISLLDILAGTGLPFKVIAIDPNEQRRNKMERILTRIGDFPNGIVKIVSPDQAVGTLTEFGSPLGCHAALEVVGSNSALALAYNLIRPFGVISSVGVHTNPTFPLTGDDLYSKNVSLAFGRCPVRRIVPKALELLGRRQNVFGIVGHEVGLIEQIVGLKDAAAAYQEFEAGLVGKTLFDPWR